MTFGDVLVAVLLILGVAFVLISSLGVLVMRQDVSGSFRAIPFRAVGENPEDNARRAMAMTVGSIAPNTYVIDIDQDYQLILVHQLVPKPGDSKSIDPLELG